MKRIRFRRSLAALLILTGLLPAATSARTLRVGTWKTAQTIQPFFYAEFMEGGDKVAVFPFTNPADQKTALLAGSLDMCGTTIVHAIHASTLGQPVVLVAALCNKSSALVVKKHGAVQSVQDLRGQRIGYVPGTMHEILLRETLTRHRLSPEKDVTLLRIDFFDMGTALARGDIDAFLSGEPFPTLAVRKGYGRILAYPYYGESIGTINAGMLVTREMIRQKPDTVYRLVKTHARATRYLTGNREAWLAKAATFGTDIDTLRAAADNMALTWDMDKAFVARVKALARRMTALGIIEQEPDYDRLIDLTFVGRVRTEP
ncbi:MAG: ABC transporter substrate-binding protein [Desulfococcus multivorans]|uniref:ABC transporter substrate-binding protein n=1 Tax=Desulfococcus sp. TaxID=2025834 RepID=UPI002A39DD44|nr:ABC transporter substrate-binding protein [Desulfococcus multivorans]